jgi:ribosomal-protein-alanine N-acetyltransferase
MICNEEIRLATIGDALRIAEMSRDLIESGLGWSWTPSRVVREINEKYSNIVVTLEGNDVIGFAVMEYLDEEARLNLFGVHPNHRRKGVGTRMIKWLEETALINGNGVVYLETRLKNHGAREFYKSLGYKVIQRIPGYYKGRETAVRMAHDLWSGVSPT